MDFWEQHQKWYDKQFELALQKLQLRDGEVNIEICEDGQVFWGDPAIATGPNFVTPWEEYDD